MSEFYQCKNCRKIFPDDDNYEDLSIPNPCCGYNPNSSDINEQLFKRVAWPAVNHTGMFDYIKSLDLDDFSARRAVIIFICSSLEFLLLDTVYELLRRYTDNVCLADALTKRSEGKSKLSELFKELNQQSIPEILQNQGKQDFWENWNKLVKARNQIAHGNFYHTPAQNQVNVEAEEKELIESVLNNSLSSFADIINNILPRN